jgi:23S rRNA G2445 N2-methylase RlmL
MTEFDFRDFAFSWFRDFPKRPWHRLSCKAQESDAARLKNGA